MRKVDSFIIGGPNYGTASLRDYLNMSPEVFTLRRVSDFIGAAPCDFSEAKRSNANLYMKDTILIDMLQINAVRKTAELIKKVFGFEFFAVGRPTVRITPAEIALVHTDLAEDIEAVRRDFGIELVITKAVA